MSEPFAESPPDPAPVLDGLRDFQRRTVDYVFERLYGDSDPTRRFLIADEVGLGKTLVARGVVARAVEELWPRLDELGRIDIVYICSNLEIAGQNVDRLRLDRNTRFAEPTRMTLLPLTLHHLRKQPLNFVSLTPATSFDEKSSMGLAKERALLFLLLESEWEFSGSAPRNLLSGDSGWNSFERKVGYLRGTSEIDEELAEAFRKRLRKGGGVRLRQRWEDLLPSFRRARPRKNREPEVKQEQRELIGALRRLLAETCVNALEPDLVILDEFQRFRNLIHADETGTRSEAGELAEVLFNYKDARILLLSATPYKAYTQPGEDGDEGDHHRDFFQTASFLLDSEPKSAELEQLLGEMRSELLHLTGNSAERLGQLKTRIESILSLVICRTERLGATPNHDGMIAEVPMRPLEPEAGDLAGYLAAARVAETLDQPEPLEHWKSAPYLLNQMDHYMLKTQLRASLAGEGDSGDAEEVEAAINAAEQTLLPFDDFRKYREINPQNARLRALASDTVDRDWWQLLWMPPSLPYYRPGGPFNAAAAGGMTKRLVFSAWTVVPKTIATLLSYSAERRIACAGGRRRVNSAEARERRGSLLEFKRSKDRLSGMPVLGLMYPSFRLAELVSPAHLGADRPKTKEPLTARGALGIVERALAPALDQLSTHATEKGVDQAWYWAAPILLDAEADPDLTAEWLEYDWITTSGSEDGGDPGDSSWWEHLELAAAVARGEHQLGQQPADLPEVLARLALAGPGVSALRSLSHSAAGTPREDEVRSAAGRVSLSLRTVFNSPESTDLIRWLNGSKDPYWTQVLGYCVDGCLQAVLDEYSHVLRESVGLVGDLPPAEVAEKLAKTMTAAISVRTSSTAVDEIRLHEGGPELVSERMRMRFAMRFGDQQGEADDQLQRAENVRHAFNSPFWPFVLATTSAGQEGLDFHPYCHAVVHWNLPPNPVDLEQREGRVHRYKGHAVRKNLATSHGAQVLSNDAGDVWESLFDAGKEARPDDANDLEPYWLAPGKARIERHVLAPALSRDRVRLINLRRDLTLYRMVFGQARQGDLLEYLSTRVSPEDRKGLQEVLRIDLEPR